MSEIGNFTSPREALTQDVASARNAINEFGGGGSAIDRVRQLDTRARELMAPRQRTIMQRFFPDALERVRIKNEVNLANTDADSQGRLLNAVRTVELQLMSDALNAVRVNQAANLRGEMAERLQRRLKDVLVNFADEFDQFNQAIMDALDRVSHYRNARVREREEQRLYDEFESFHRVRVRLVKNFERIVDEEVRA